MESRDCLNVSLENSLYSISQKTLDSFSQKFLEGFPFAYLTRFSEFYFRKFYVDSRVLIPRNETELLVDLIKQENTEFKSICDVGVGSGVILLSLVTHKGFGIDISPDALEVTKINARRFRLENSVTLHQGDRLYGVSEKFDLIVSNPPYIKESSHRKLVHNQVDRYEPHMALFLKDDDYEEWFLTFFNQVKTCLNKDGLFYMEGHELELEHQRDLLLQLGFDDVKVIKDYAGLNRFIRAKRG